MYVNNNKLYTTKPDNLDKVNDLFVMNSLASKFDGKENEFFGILSSESINKDLKHLTHESRLLEAKRKFSKYTGVYNKTDIYDKNINVGYKVFLLMKNPTIYSYIKKHPAISEFFRLWNYYKLDPINNGMSVNYDLSLLFGGMYNFKELELIFKKENGDVLMNLLYRDFPEFAIFYYEIYPYLNLEKVNSYDIFKLFETRNLLYDLSLSSNEVDTLVEHIPVANNNTLVLKLMNGSN